MAQIDGMAGAGAGAGRLVGSIKVERVKDRFPDRYNDRTDGSNALPNSAGNTLNWRSMSVSHADGAWGPGDTALSASIQAHRLPSIYTGGQYICKRPFWPPYPNPEKPRRGISAYGADSFNDRRIPGWSKTKSRRVAKQPFLLGGPQAGATGRPAGAAFVGVDISPVRKPTYLR